jgi:hypothetical protein
MYSTYEEEDESGITDRDKIVILGGGPNRIGQGIEFDYCCVHAAFALREAGFETIMVNCNPETVSTDYDTSDRLYFEPVTAEHVLEILDREARSGRIVGVIVQFGGQTPLKLAAHHRARRLQAPRHHRRRHRHGRGPRPLRRARRPPRHPLPALGRRPLRGRGRRHRPGHRLPGARPPELRARRPRPCASSTARSSSTSTCAPPCSPAPTTRCWSTSSCTTPPSSTSTPSPTPAPWSSPASWNTSRRPACTPATPPAPCPPSTSPRRSSTRSGGSPSPSPASCRSSA